MERGYLTWAFSFWNSLYVQHGNVWVSTNKSSREQTSPNRHFYENDRSQNKHLGYQYLIEKKKLHSQEIDYALVTIQSKQITQNTSHPGRNIVLFCLKKKKKMQIQNKRATTVSSLIVYTLTAGWLLKAIGSC